MAEDTKTLTVSLIARTDRFTSEMRRARGEMQSFNKGGVSLSKGLKGLAGSFGLMVGAGGVLVGLGREMMAGAKTAIEFEAAFASVQKTVDATTEQYAEMKRELIELSKATGDTAVSLFEAAGAAGQLGIARENIVEFTKIMSQMGVASDLTAEEAAIGFAKWTNITGLAEEEISNLSSAIVALGNNTGSTESQILAMSVRFAGAAKAAGISDAGIAALAASLTEVGIEAESGGSSVVKIINEIQRSVASGGKSLEVFATTAGMSTRDFAKAFKDDALGAITEVMRGFKDYVDAGEPAIKILEAMGLQEIRTSQAVQGLAGNFAGLVEATKLSEESFKENIARQAEFDKKSATTQAAIDRMMASWAAFRNELWDSVIPAVNDTANAIAGLLEKMTDMAGGVEQEPSKMGRIFKAAQENIKGEDVADPFVDQMARAYEGSVFRKSIDNLFKSLGNERKKVIEESSESLKQELQGAGGVLDFIGYGSTQTESRAGGIAEALAGNAEGAVGIVKGLFDTIGKGWEEAKYDGKRFWDSSTKFAKEYAGNLGQIWSDHFDWQKDPEEQKKFVGSLLGGFQDWADTFGAQQKLEEEHQAAMLADMEAQEEEQRKMYEETQRRIDAERDWYRERANMGTGSFTEMRAGTFAGTVGGIYNSDYALSAAGRDMQRDSSVGKEANTVPLLQGILNAAQMTAQNTRNGMVAVAG